MMDRIQTDITGIRTCNLFDGERAIYAACTAVWYIIIGWPV
jgi:hypothetical protein